MALVSLRSVSLLLLLVGPPQAMSTPLTHEEVSAALIDDALCISEGGQETCGLALVQRWAAQRSLEAGKKQPKLLRAVKPAKDERVLEDEVAEAETKVGIDKLDEDVASARAGLEIDELEDKLREAKSEQKVARLKVQVKEAEDKKRLDKLEGDLDSKSGDKSAASQVNKDASSVKGLKQELQDAQNSAKKQKLDDELGQNDAEESVDKLKREVKKAKIEAKSEKLADKVAETKTEDDDYVEDEEDTDLGDIDDEASEDAAGHESSVSAESADGVEDWKRALEDDLSDPDAERKASGESEAAEDELEDGTGADWDEAPPPAAVDPAPTVEPIEPADPDLLPADASPMAEATGPGDLETDVAAAASDPAFTWGD